jgi:hypothetical protein
MIVAIPRFFFAKRVYKWSLVIAGLLLIVGFGYLVNRVTNPDFGSTFGSKATKARAVLQQMDSSFALCAPLCRVSPQFMQALVFPEVMRYSTLKDGIETESLRTLYVQFGEDYADFSIGLFQMKPSFAQTVETKARQWLPDSIYQELQLAYTTTAEEDIRMERVERMQDKDYQLVYLTAFIAICNQLYQHHTFSDESEKLRWYATVYNAGFDKPDSYIAAKIKQSHFYLQQGMPGKKFRYAAVAEWYFGGAVDGGQMTVDG